MTPGIRGPRSDAEVPAFWASLGVAGGVDVHVHFMPERLQEKVWAWFDRVVDEDGRPVWPIYYREDAGARAERLRAMGLRAWPALLYAHRPGMAEWLNDWGVGAAPQEVGALPSATFYAEDGADAYVATALERGARVFKVHFEVGRFEPAAAVLRPVWRRLAAARVPVVVHAGGAPVAGPFTGSAKLAEVLALAPDLVAVIAHLGMPEYATFLDLALAHEHVHLDTTMVFTDFTEARWPYPQELVERLAQHPARVVLGSDFPTIPHSYAHQLAALAGLGLGREWLRAVCHDNGARLLGLSAQ